MEKNYEYRYEVFYGDFDHEYRQIGTNCIGEAYKHINLLMSGRLRLNQVRKDVWIVDLKTGLDIQFMYNSLPVPFEDRVWGSDEDYAEAA